MRVLKANLLLAAMLLMVLQASAISLDADTDTVIEQDTEANFTVSDCEEDDVSLNVTGPVEDELTVDDGNATFNQWDGTGEYDFEAQCGDEDEESDTVTIIKDALKIESLGLEEFRIEGENNFQLELSSEEDALSEEDIEHLNITTDGEKLYEKNGFEEEFSLTTDDWSLAGREGLNASIKYSKNSSSTTEAFEFEGVEFSEYRLELKGFILDGRDVEFTRFSRDSLEDLQIAVNVYEEPSSENVTGLIEEDFKIESETGEGEVNLRAEDGADNDGRNPYLADISARPSMNSEREEFKLTVPDKLSSAVNFTAYTDTNFRGHVRNQDRDPVETTFVMRDPDKDFSTDSDGWFNEEFSQSTIKSVEATFPNATLEMTDLESGFRDSENIYQSFYNDPEPSGLSNDLRPVNMLGLRTNYPVDVDGSELFLDYDTSGIDASEIELYECTDWDFFGESCQSSWEQISIEENQEVWGELRTDDLSTVEDGDQGISSAYLAAVEIERADLKFDSEPSISQEKINIDDGMIIDGKLVEEQELSGVEDADVRAEIYKESDPSNRYEIGEDTEKDTDEDGEFELEMEDLPNASGEYQVDIHAEKEYYNSLEQTLNQTFEIYKNKQLDLSPPSDPEIRLGDRSTEVFELENTGQATLENITLEGLDVSSRDLTINPSEVTMLEPGETESISVNFLLPSDYCDTYCEEGETPRTGLVAEQENESVSAEAEAEIELTEEEKESIGLGEDDEDDSETGEDDETSVEYVIWPSDLGIDEFMEDDDLVEEAVTAGLLLFITASLVIAVKKKKSSGRDDFLPREDKIRGRVLETSISGGGKSHFFQLKYGNTEFEDKEQLVETLKQRLHREHQETSTKCEICGEEFDTETAASIHKEIKHE